MSKEKFYKEWRVEGLIVLRDHDNPDNAEMNPQKFAVRYTSDEIGKSLSISDEETGVLFMIPFDIIDADIKEYNNPKVLFFCDGAGCETKRNCGHPCNHTFDVKHAKNFTQFESENLYYETEEGEE